VLALAANGINSLTAELDWVPIGPLPPQSVTSIAFDARNNVFMFDGHQLAETFRLSVAARL